MGMSSKGVLAFGFIIASDSPDYQTLLEVEEKGSLPKKPRIDLIRIGYGDSSDFVLCVLGTYFAAYDFSYKVLGQSDFNIDVVKARKMLADASKLLNIEYKQAEWLLTSYPCG